MLSDICQAFGCLPTRALWELEHDPERWVLQIMRVRAYERAKALVDQAKSEADLPKSELIEHVIETRLELKYAIFKQRLAEAAERKRRQQQDG